MISADDIDAFRAASEEPLAVADAVVRRAGVSTIKNRIFRDCEEMQIVRALRAYQQIIAWQAQAIEGYQQDAARRYDESVGCFDP